MYLSHLLSICIVEYFKHKTNNSSHAITWLTFTKYILVKHELLDGRFEIQNYATNV